MKNDPAMKSSAMAMFVGSKILKEISNKKVDHISIYDIYELLRESGIYGSRSLLFGLSFLYSVDIIYFEEGMIWVKKSNTSA